MRSVPGNVPWCAADYPVDRQTQTPGRSDMSDVVQRPIPVWKRKGNVDEVVLQRGAKYEKEHTNALGSSVSQKLCSEILFNENPKNLIAAIKRANPPMRDRRKPIDEYYDDGRMRPHAMQEHIFNNFPEGAVPNCMLRKALIGALHEEGFNHANTLHIACRSPDDPCVIFKKDWAFPDETFNIGGLCGLPFGGKASLQAALKRVPDGGCLLIEYASHTGLDYEGNVGRVARYDASQDLYSMPQRTMHEAVEIYESLVEDPDRDLTSDAPFASTEYDALCKIVRNHFDRISAANDTHHYIASMLQHITRRAILRFIESSPEYRNIVCVLVGGIQIENPSTVLEHQFVLKTFEIRSTKGALSCQKERLEYYLRREREQRHASEMHYDMPHK